MGILAIVGGSLIMLFNGCYFLWSSISNYVLSYMFMYDKSIDQSGSFIFNVVILALSITGHWLGAYLIDIKRVDVRLLTVGFGLFALIGIYISSYMTSLTLFTIFYGGFCGLGTGVIYMVAFITGWEWFPERRGLMTGISLFSYGLGSFFFTLLANNLINPNDLKPTIIINKDLRFFDEEIALNLPYMVRTLAYIWLL